MSFIDPFCGSGTLGMGAIDFYEDNSRSYAFQKSIKLSLSQSSLQKQELPFRKYILIDKNDKTLEICKKNLTHTKKSISIEFLNLDSCQPGVQIDKSNLKSWIYSNLPYGKRVEDALPSNFVDILVMNFKPKIMGLFYPEKLNHPLAKKNIYFKIKKRIKC